MLSVDLDQPDGSCCVLGFYWMVSTDAKENSAKKRCWPGLGLRAPDLRPRPRRPEALIGSFAGVARGLLTCRCPATSICFASIPSLVCEVKFWVSVWPVAERDGQPGAFHIRVGWSPSVRRKVQREGAEEPGCCWTVA